MTGETEQLGQFLADVTYEDLPDRMVDEVKRMAIDTIGVSVVAAREDSVRIADRVARKERAEGPSARVLGSGGGGSVTDAAFVNGIMAHAIDFDDTHARLGGHPSVPVLPPALALAESTNASGREFITAFGLGAEVETILGDVMNPGHYEHGWHPTSVFGQLAAAVAAGVLMDFDADQFAQAIGLAASGASGIKANFGTMTKPYHVGDAARGGLEAAQLVADGFTASTDALEADVGGYCKMFQGDPPYEFGDRFEHLGDPWGLVNPPAGFKPYPCCGSTHAPIDAALEIRESGDLTLDDVERVDIVEHPRRLPHTNRPKPTTALEGKFSVQYVVSVALRDGDVWLDDFTDEAVADPEIQQFLERVNVEADTDVASRVDQVPGATRADWTRWDTRFTKQVPRKKHAYLRVETKDGSLLESYVDAPTGTPPNPMSDDELREKYRRCTTRQLPDEKVEASLDKLTNLESVSDVESVVDDLTSV